MKTLRLFSLVLLSVLPLSAQNNKGTISDLVEVETVFESSEDFAKAYTNLPTEQKKAYSKAFLKARQYSQEKRIFECLDSLYKAEKILKGGPAVQNIFGSCYVEFRDFKQAEVHFTASYKMDTTSIGSAFNLAEVAFVTKKWQSALDRLTVVTSMTKKFPFLEMTQLCEFKILLCHLKLEQEDKSRKLAKKYSFRDDTPYYYYANAALAFHDKDSVTAARWLRAGRAIYGPTGKNQSWEDTLIEFGFLNSLLISIDDLLEKQ